jgi:hypothetical protein
MRFNMFLVANDCDPADGKYPLHSRNEIFWVFLDFSSKDEKENNNPALYPPVFR